MADSKRQDIIDAIETRMKTILVAGGYETNLGSNVFIWKATPFQSTEVPGVDVRDVDDISEAQTVGEEIHTMPIECRCHVGTTASMTDVRKITADINKAVGVDVTWSGLAEDTTQVQGGLADIEIGNEVNTIVVVKFSITYVTGRYDSYG